jgi:2-methylcitrate dehydratase
MVAVALIPGRLTAADYEDGIAAVPRIDALRATIACVEDPAFTAGYHDPARRAIPNGLSVVFKDGSRFGEVVVEYPLGHARRRAEAIPLLLSKFRTNLARRFPEKQQHAILAASLDPAALEAMPVHEYVNLYVI